MAGSALTRANPDQLRADIDRGLTGDKVAFPDPAAAPLGTDEEAAGTPVDAQASAMALAMETARSRPRPDPRGPRAGHRWLLIAVVVILAVAIVAPILLH